MSDGVCVGVWDGMGWDWLYTAACLDGITRGD